MGKLREALDALANLPVAGVTRWGAGDSPAELDAAHLPALVIVPNLRRGALFGQRGDGFSMVSLGEAGAVYTVEVSHVLAVWPEGRGRTPAPALPALADLIDGYFAALRADVRLGGALRHPARVEVELGTVEVGNGRFWGAVFRHGWTIEV